MMHGANKWPMAVQCETFKVPSPLNQFSVRLYVVPTPWSFRYSLLLTFVRSALENRKLLV